MKKLLFFLLGVLMITSSSASEYQYIPLVREGVKWVEYFENEDIPVPGNQQIIYFQFNGTTTISNNNYHNLYATIGTDVISGESVPIALVRENDKKVYAILNDDFQFIDFPIHFNLTPFNGCKTWSYVDDYYKEYKIFDFNDIASPYDEDLMTGDPVISTYDYGDYSVNNYTIPTNALYDFSSDDHFCDFQIREGIGTLHEVFINPWPLYPTNGSEFNLAWVEENGEIIYKGGFYEKAKSIVENQYLPLVKDGKKWVDYYSDFEHETGIICFQLLGETEINGITYNNLFATTNNDNLSAESTPIAFIREQDKKVYAIVNENRQYVDFPDGYDPLSMVQCKYDASTNEYLIYNFNDITSAYNDDYFAFTTNVVDIIQEEVNGQLVNIYSVPTDYLFYYDSRDYTNNFRVQEGVGTLHEVFINPWPLYPTNGLDFNLAWVEDEGNYLYKGANFDKAHGLMTAISTINSSNQVASVRYYNLAGVESSEPFKGMNIRVTTYTDGTRHSEKIVK